MKQAIQKLPTDLEKLYMSFLESKRGSEPLCDPRPIIAVCAAPKPMDEEALRELLALDMATGSYASDEMSSTDAVIQSGVGLLTLDSTEKLILPVHDTVRAFIFSDAATGVTNRLLHSDSRVHKSSPFQAATRREPEARVALGAACLLHLQHQLRTSRSLTTGPTQMQKTLPTMGVSVPTWLQGPIKTILPHASKKAAVTVHLPSRKRNAPPQHDGFFQYARENWLACNLDLCEVQFEFVDGRVQERLFQRIAMERTESWDIHPWQGSTIRSASQQLAGMFAYSIANGHKPLLELALQHKDSLPKDLFTGLLPNHGHLPALHVACKLGHDLLLDDLSKVCNLSTRCHMSKTAVHYAAEYGHMNCIEKIATYFRRGSGVACTLSQIIDLQDLQSRTALHLAIMNGHKYVALFLAGTCKARVSLADKSGSTAIELACDSGYGDDILRTSNSSELEWLGKTDYHGQSRLILAAMAGNIRRVSVLCSVCDISAPDVTGMTAVVHACRGGHEHVLQSLLGSRWFKLDKELTAELRGERLALTVAAAAGHANIVRVLLENDFATPGPMLVNFPFETWRPVEAAVFGHYYGVSSSLNAARAIVGDMSASLQEPRDTTIFFMRKDEQGILDISLRAAAEIGQVDAVRHLLKLQHTPPYQALTESDGKEILKYLDRRGMKTEAMEKVGIHVKTSLMPQMDFMDCLPLPVSETDLNPIPVFLAAVRQHEEVLTLLLPGRNTDYIQGLMERARGIHLGGKFFDDFLKAHC